MRKKFVKTAFKKNENKERELKGTKRKALRFKGKKRQESSETYDV